MKFGITCDVKDKLAVEGVKNILDTLKSRGHTVKLEESLRGILKGFKFTSIKGMDVEMILAVGDDANLLRTFRELDKNKIPVLGINCGASGFLAEVDIKKFDTVLKRIEKKRYSIEERSRLSVRIDGKRQPFALNELVISASKGATIIRYTLKVDGETIYRDSADGIIISTPTGSTGYALSAGGPIVSTKSNVFVIIPICSLNQNKPFIVADNSKIVITDITSSTTCNAIIDGRYRVELNENTIEIKRASVPAHFVKFEDGLHSRVFIKLREKSEMHDVIPRDAPPSTKFIYKILQYEGALTQKEIVNLSMLPPRTVRFALNYLIKHGLVEKRTSLRDTRQSIYFVK